MLYNLNFGKAKACLRMTQSSLRDLPVIAKKAGHGKRNDHALKKKKSIRNNAPQSHNPEKNSSFS